MKSKEFHEILNLLGKTPKRIELVIETLSEDGIRLKPSEEEFSILEHICHLRDIESEGYRDRIGKILDGNMPFLADIDGDELARERDYNHQEVLNAVSAFVKFREENILVLQNIKVEKLHNEGVLENVGTITLAKLLLIIREHDKEHLQIIDELALQATALETIEHFGSRRLVERK